MCDLVVWRSGDAIPLVHPPAGAKAGAGGYRVRGSTRASVDGQSSMRMRDVTAGSSPCAAYWWSPPVRASFRVGARRVISIPTLWDRVLNFYYSDPRSEAYGCRLVPFSENRQLPGRKREIPVAARYGMEQSVATGPRRQSVAAAGRRAGQASGLMRPRRSAFPVTPRVMPASPTRTASARLTFTYGTATPTASAAFTPRLA